MCLVLFTAGGSRDSRRQGRSRGEGPRGRSWPCWPKGWAWFSRTVGGCKFVGKLQIFRWFKVKRHPCSQLLPRVCVTSSALFHCTESGAATYIFRIKWAWARSWLFSFSLTLPILTKVSQKGRKGERQRNRQRFVGVPGALEGRVS